MPECPEFLVWKYNHNAITCKRVTATSASISYPSIQNTVYVEANNQTNFWLTMFKSIVSLNMHYIVFCQCDTNIFSFSFPKRFVSTWQRQRMRIHPRQHGNTKTKCSKLLPTTKQDYSKSIDATIRGKSSASSAFTENERWLDPLALWVGPVSSTFSKSSVFTCPHGNGRVAFSKVFTLKPI